MRSFLSRTIWPWAAAIAALALLAGAALAHDDRHVGEYKLNVGFNIEPAYEGVANGIDIRVTRAAEGGHEDDHDGDGHDGDGMSMTDEDGTAAPAGSPWRGWKRHYKWKSPTFLRERPVSWTCGRYSRRPATTPPT